MKSKFLTFCIVLGIASIEAIPTELNTLYQSFEKAQKTQSIAQELDRVIPLDRAYKKNVLLYEKYTPLMTAIDAYIKMAYALQAEGKSKVPDSSKKRSEVIKESTKNIIKFSQARRKVEEQFAALKD